MKRAHGNSAATPCQYSERDQLGVREGAQKALIWGRSDEVGKERWKALKMLLKYLQTTDLLMEILIRSVRSERRCSTDTDEFLKGFASWRLSRCWSLRGITAYNRNGSRRSLLLPRSAAWDVVTLDSDRGKHRLERSKGKGSWRSSSREQGCQGLPWRLLATISCIGSFKVRDTKECLLRSKVMT